MRVAIALLALALTPLLAWADRCRSRVVAVKQVKAVVAPVVAAVAVPLVYPAYSASYSSESAALLEEIRRLRADVQALKGGAAPVEPVSLATLVGARCASCHQDGKAEAAGGGFVLAEKDGSVPPLSLAEKRRIVQLVESGQMPPKAPLPDAEKRAIKDALTRRD